MVFRSVICSVLLLFLSIPFEVKAQGQEIISGYQVIANDAGISEISLDELRNRFKGKHASWETDSEVLIVLPSSKNEHAEAISELIYNKSFYGVKKFWLSLVFQGRFSPPHFLDSDEEIAKFVSNNEGAIGLISKGFEVSENLKIDLKD